MFNLNAVFQRVNECMRTDYQPGSDPGLCVAASVPEAIIQFGRRANVELVTQEEAASWLANMEYCWRDWEGSRAA